jgi:transposase-like protein
LVKLLEGGHVFERKRKSDTAKALAVFSYHFGLSLRRASQMVSFIEPASHEAVRKWYRRLGKHIPAAKRRRRAIVAIDETKLKICGHQVFLWAAIDVHSREIVYIGLSSGRTDWEAATFIRKVLDLCAGTPIFLTDRGPWYEKAFRKMGIRFQRMTHGLRNSIEQWFGLLKSRTKRFHNSFPHRSSIHSTRSWTDAFRNIYQLDRRIVQLEEVLS